MSAYNKFVAKHFHSVRADGNLTPAETISVIAKMWKKEARSPRRSPVYRRCDDDDDDDVRDCHSRGRICSQNTKKKSRRYSASRK